MDELTIRKINIDKNGNFQKIFNYILILYAVLEILCETVVGKYFLAWMERFQIIFAFALIVMFVMKFFMIGRDAQRAFLKRNILVFVYFAFRLITFIYIGMQYTMIRSVLFEILYLLVLTEILIDNAFVRQTIFKLFIAINVILNLINTFFHLYCEPLRASGITDNTIYNFALKYTYMEKFSFETICSMYSNPNQMGVMTGLALLISLTYLKKKMSNKAKVLYVIYVGFSLYALYLSRCNSAQIALLAAVLAFAAVKLVRVISPKMIAYACLASCLIVTGGILGFVASHGDLHTSYTEKQWEIDRFTSTRYTIWRNCYFTHKTTDEVLLGNGNVALEKLDRAEYMHKIKVYKGGITLADMKQYLGTHNGYIGMLYCTGALGALVFLVLLIKKMKESKALSKDSKYYMAIVYMLVDNLLESFMVVNKSSPVFIFFLILAMKSENEEVEE